MIIDDELLQQAKKRAGEQGVTVSDVVNRALREAFSERRSAAALPPFQMVTFGRGQPTVDHLPADLSRAADQDDEQALRGS
ncbi:MAG: hypothetical protein ABI629_21265 [bacterium]